jgi:hypothetical protein
LYTDVVRFIQACPVCDRVNTTFNSEDKTLHPTPVQGLMYTWFVDLCGPFETSLQGNRYCMLMIEHFSKHLELVAIPNKTSMTTARVFRDNVLSTFGACAVVRTDQGDEFQGEFAQLLRNCLIDHRVGSPNHPQSQGQVERAVQTVKQCLRKMVQDCESKVTWDTMLAWIRLGYNCSKHKSTGLSPAQVLYARDPVIPPAIVERMEEPLELTADQTLHDTKLLVDRAEAVQRHAALLDNNLRIQQHQDCLRYAHTRSGAYVPRTHRFAPGDYVYVRYAKSALTTLDTPARPDPVRVTRVGLTGTLTVVDYNGRSKQVHPVNCAPCHLPVKQIAIDHRLSRHQPGTACRGCRRADKSEPLFLCDICNQGWHGECLPAPPPRTDEENPWVCPACAEAGVTPVMGPIRLQASASASPAQITQADKDRAINGRYIRKVFQGDYRWWGILQYRGAIAGSKPFRVYYEDTEIEDISSAEAHKLLEPEDTEWPPNVFKPVPTDIATHERVAEGTPGRGTSTTGQEPTAAGTSQQAGKPRRGRPPKQERNVKFAPEVLAALQAMVTNIPATVNNAPATVTNIPATVTNAHAKVANVPTEVTVYPTSTVCERRMWRMVNGVWQRTPQ